MKKERSEEEEGEVFLHLPPSGDTVRTEGGCHCFPIFDLFVPFFGPWLVRVDAARAKAKQKPISACTETSPVSDPEKNFFPRPLIKCFLLSPLRGILVWEREGYCSSSSLLRSPSFPFHTQCSLCFPPPLFSDAEAFNGAWREGGGVKRARGSRKRQR